MKKCNRDIIILHMCTKNHNYMIYGSWDTEWDRQKCFVILGHFLPFYSPSSPPPSPIHEENQNFEKMKKTPDNIIILWLCTINDNHMMYISCVMKRDWQNFWSFWTVFCPFTLLTTKKIKISKNWKKHL